MSVHVEPVAAGVLRLGLRSWQGTLTGYRVSAYVVDNVLVDTGPPHARRALLRALESITPRGVVVTHWHEDHAGNVAALAARGVPVRMHSDAERKLRGHVSVRAYRRFTWGQPPRLVAPLRDFDLGPLRVLPAPGHSPDHQIVWDSERRLLISGDLFLGVKVRVAHASESPRQLVATLRAAAALEPHLLLDAHRGVVHDPVPRLRAKIDWMEEMIDTVVSLHDRGLDERAIRQRVLGAEALVGWMSGGEYSKGALVRAVLREREETKPARPPSDRTSVGPSRRGAADTDRAGRDDVRGG